MDKIIVKSLTFSDGGEIPVDYTCDGMDISPEIFWDNIPDETKSFVLMMEDIDSSSSVTHWIVYDIPSTLRLLPENFPKIPQIDGIKQGINDLGRIGYGGPCPPKGSVHRYAFNVYAVSVPSLELSTGATRKIVEEKMEGKILSKGILIGIYGR
ncbi:YbhB/YbcL family Raf kinase inhibitor-like protein [Persephonella sp.]